jgi:crotonobetainyl-CoA:carnitine CoA-transferase CaiB-like acyl-CoA transferase
MDGQRLGVRLQPPTQGQHTAEVLQGLGYTEADMARLRAQAAVA